MNIIAIDIGGSSVKSGLVEKQGDKYILASEVTRSHLHTKDISEIKEILISICRNYISKGEAPLIGIATAGSVDTNETVIHAGNFVNYCNINWSEIIREQFPAAMVSTVNDGRSSAWGEYIASEKKATTHVHAVIGTGIGGGIIHKGDLLIGDSGQAGYIGHIKVMPSSDRICSCGKSGCVESFSSVRGIMATYNELCDGNSILGDVDFPTLIHRYSEDPDNIYEALVLSGYWLGITLGNVMNTINPQVITFGGGVIVGTNSLVIENNLNDNPYLLGAREGIHYAAHSRIEATGELRIGLLGNDAGLIGAASLAYEKFAYIVEVV